MSILLGEYTDSAVIFVILLLNAAIGFFQEYKAEKSIEALRRMTSLKATVIRDGKEAEIEASLLVPGDIILLESGKIVPADARIIEQFNLQTQEATLTGESVPVMKKECILPEETMLGNLSNMVFSGTVVVSGRATAVVTGTGMSTQIGKIAKMIDQTDRDMNPLQKQLKVLGKILGAATVIIAVIVFLVGIGTGKDISEMLLTSISLAVAAIPEGLPAVVTISLALGVQRMARRNSIIRKLASVSTLGSTTVICTDKTGTLTRNEMTVRKIYVDGKAIDVTGKGYSTKGDFLIGKKNQSSATIEKLLEIGAICNDARFSEDDLRGDPMEIAFLVSAKKYGLSLAKKMPRINEIGFTSERKMMSTYNHTSSGRVVYTKGAPDVVIRCCSSIMSNGRIRKITSKDRKEILDAVENFSKDALRVIGFAFRKSSSLAEDNLTFVGLQAVIDPPREGVREAISKCKDAGIRVVMITGDYACTAEAIASDVGIEGKAVLGEDIEKMRNLENEVEHIGIYARVNPEHKLRIVEAFKKRGHVVAMTGDGINDAPALKKADIGIAMGKTGTDVTKEASDMLLADDNFVTIVNAIEEGRGIGDNIRKFVNYLLSSNLGEILIIFVALIIGLPLPLLAIHLLWINIITDGFPALALGVDPAEKDIMKKPPRKKDERIMNREMALAITFSGIVITIGALAMFEYYLSDGLEKARTIAFTSMVLFEIVRLHVIRSHYKIGIFSNKWLNLGVISSLMMQLLIIYSPFNVFFDTVPLSLSDWGIMLSVCLGALFSVMALRMLHRSFTSNKS